MYIILLDYIKYYFFKLLSKLKIVVVWTIVIFMTLIFYSYGNFILSTKDMFLFSTGLITILTFVVTYFNSNMNDFIDKENFYFGINMKKRYFYRNFWINVFLNIKIKVFLWLMILIPSFIYIETKIELINRYSHYLKEIYIKMLNSIWLSTALIVVFLCVAILISAIDICRSYILENKIYGVLKFTSEYSIEKELKSEYKQIFMDLFFGNLLDIKDKTSRLTANIIEISHEVCESQTDTHNYIRIAYGEQNLQLLSLFERIKNLYLVYEDKKINFIENRLMILIEKVKFYYQIKWNKLEYTLKEYNDNRLFLYFFNNDLEYLLDLENFFKEDSNVLYSKYCSVFWGNYRDNFFCSSTNQEENLLIAKIINLLENRLNEDDFYNNLTFEEMYDILSKIKSIDDSIKGNNYCLKIFKCIFKKILNHLEETSGFFYKLKNILLENKNKIYIKEYILELVSECSYEQMTIYCNYNLEKLKFLLYFLDKKQIIVSLIIRLIREERSRPWMIKKSERPIMKKTEFNIWKNQIERLDNFEYNEIQVLYKNKFINELKYRIDTAEASYLISDELLYWLWDSLFKNFDKRLYEEFKQLYVNGLRNNFNIDSYIIFRMLLSYKYAQYGWNSGFNDKDKEEMSEYLFSIKDIIETDDEYVYLLM